jgi:hypothetical protein
MCNAVFWSAMTVNAVTYGAVLWLLIRAWRTFVEMQDLRDDALKYRDEARLLRNTWKLANMASDAVNRKRD